MSIYNMPEKYAEYTRMPIEDAETRCAYFKKIQEELQEQTKCPLCQGYTLAYEAGEYEAGISAYVYCDDDKGDCEFTADGDYGNFESRMHADFDAVLMFAGVLETEGLEAIEHQLGVTWDEFLTKESSDMQ